MSLVCILNCLSRYKISFISRKELNHRYPDADRFITKEKQNVVVDTGVNGVSMMQSFSHGAGELRAQMIEFPEHCGTV